MAVGRARRSHAGRSVARVGRAGFGRTQGGWFNNSYHLLTDLTKLVLEVDTLNIDTVEMDTLQIDTVEVNR